MLGSPVNIVLFLETIRVWGSAGWLALSLLSYHWKIMMLKRFHMLQIEAFMVIYDSFRLIKTAGRVHSVYCD